MAWPQFHAFEPWSSPYLWPAHPVHPAQYATSNANAQRHSRSSRHGGKGSKRQNNSQALQIAHQGRNGGVQPPGIWTMPDPGKEDLQAGGIRSEVLALRNARDSEARQSAVENLKTALLTAVHADEALDGMLLGMAAAQCAKHGLSELMGLLCSYVSCRLGNYEGREVAEMTSAAAKLGCGESGFMRAVVAFCSAPAKGLFVSARDVGMAASALLQSLKQDYGRGFKGNRDSQTRSRVNYVAGFLGLAEAAIATLNDGVPVRDLAELAHVFGHALDAPATGGEALHEQPAVKKVIRAAVQQLRLGIHLASARDATMAAGAIAASWPHMEPERAAVFGPCLVDIAQMARFRRSDFNPQDLSLLALAFAKTDTATRDLIDVLNEQVVARVTEFSNKDLVLLLDAGTQTEAWIGSLFVKTAAAAVSKCRLAEFPAQDLSMLAQSLALLGADGKEPLQRLAGEAFRRQLCFFSSKDKALLLWALAKVRSEEAALIRIAVRLLGVEDCTILDKETLCSTLWALARVWAQLPKGDPWPQSLLCSLCSTCPWVEARATQVCDVAWALGHLPVPLETEVWGSFLTSVEKLPRDACTVQELCLLLSGLSRSPRGFAARRDGLANQFLADLARKLPCNDEAYGVGDSRLLSEAMERTSWNVPPGVPEFVKRFSLEACADGDDAADADSQEDSTSTNDEHIATASGDARSASPTPSSSEGSAVHEVSRQEEEAIAVEPPPPHFSEHGQGHSCAECDGHGHGHGHGNGHNHGHCHQQLDAATDKGTASNHNGHCDTGICSSAYKQAAAEEQSAHGLEGGQLCQSECCPTIFDSNDFGNVRLNAHCDFQGHCVQIKNTFLHISCGQGNDTHSEESCMVCKMTRSRSVDDVRSRSGGALDGFLELPPGLGDASFHSSRTRQRDKGGKSLTISSKDDNNCSSPCGSKCSPVPSRAGS